MDLSNLSVEEIKTLVASTEKEGCLSCGTSYFVYWFSDNSWLESPCESFCDASGRCDRWGYSDGAYDLHGVLNTFGIKQL